MENVDAVTKQSSNELGDGFNLGMAGRPARPRGVCLPRYFKTLRAEIGGMYFRILYSGSVSLK